MLRHIILAIWISLSFQGLASEDPFEQLFSDHLVTKLKNYDGSTKGLLELIELGHSLYQQDLDLVSLLAPYLNEIGATRAGREATSLLLYLFEKEGFEHLSTVYQRVVNRTVAEITRLRAELAEATNILQSLSATNSLMQSFLDSFANIENIKLQINIAKSKQFAIESKIADEQSSSAQRSHRCYISDAYSSSNLSGDVWYLERQLRIAERSQMNLKLKLSLLKPRDFPKGGDWVSSIDNENKERKQETHTKIAEINKTLQLLEELLEVLFYS